MGLDRSYKTDSVLHRTARHLFTCHHETASCCPALARIRVVAYDNLARLPPRPRIPNFAKSINTTLIPRY